MSKKKKSLKMNIATDSASFVDVEKYNLPQTLGNVPKSVQAVNDSAFNAIKPQLESFVADG